MFQMNHKTGYGQRCLPATDPWIFSGDKFLGGLMAFAHSAEGRTEIEKIPRNHTLDARLRSLTQAAQGINGTQGADIRTLLATSLLL